jgi:uridine phosphorylase
MNTQPFAPTELILNPDGSVYHLQLKNEHVADVVLLVGDPARVFQISRHFSHIEHKISHREFVTHTGWYNAKRITALSSGIGTDNIDIVLNELHAAVNINPLTRMLNPVLRRLSIIRIGTSGALHETVPVGSHVASAYSLGLDGLLYYYNYPFTTYETALKQQFLECTDWPPHLATPYFVRANDRLLQEVGHDMLHGITATATGFYGPQGRCLLGNATIPLAQLLSKAQMGSLSITNFDMETAAIYGLGRVFGFDCVTANTIIANRVTKTFATNVPKQVDELIETVLDRV